MRDLLIAIENLHRLAKRPDKVILSSIRKNYDMSVSQVINMLHIEVRYDAKEGIKNEILRQKLFDLLLNRIGINVFKSAERGIPSIAIPMTEIDSVSFNSVTDMSLDFDSVRLLSSVSIVFQNHVDVMITEKGLYITAPEDIVNIECDMIHAKSGKCCLRMITISDFWN